MADFLREYASVVQVILAIIPAALVYIATTKGQRAAPYESLAKRVERLENQVEGLEGKNRKLEDQIEGLETKNLQLEKENCDLKEAQESDREFIKKLICLLEDRGIEVPVDWFPDWWYYTD